MTTSFIVLEESATGLKVTKLQSALKQLNLYFGPIDGILGVKTQAALIKFQKSYNHLPDNGLIDAETIVELDEAVWLSRKEILREGCSGEEVKALQEMLTACDIQSLTVDGYFGRKTKEAVIWFQQNWGLPTDGIVRQETWIALYGHLIHGIPYEDRVKAFFGDLDTETFIKLPVKNGDSGRNVLIVQKFLNYFFGSTYGILEDGNFGELTEQVVKNFQERKALFVDGVVGIKTYEAMLSEGFNQQLIDELLSYRYGKSLNFTQGKEYEVVEDVVVRGEIFIHRFEVEPEQNFRVVLNSLGNNAVFELIGIVDGKVYAQRAINSQLFLEAGSYFLNVAAIRGNANYKLHVESLSGR